MRKLPLLLYLTTAVTLYLTSCSGLGTETDQQDDSLNHIDIDVADTLPRQVRKATFEKVVNGKKIALKDHFERDIRKIFSLFNQGDFEGAYAYYVSDIYDGSLEEEAAKTRSLLHEEAQLKLFFKEIYDVSAVWRFEGVNYCFIDFAYVNQLTLQDEVLFAKDRILQIFTNNGCKIKEVNSNVFEALDPSGFIAIQKHPQGDWKYIRCSAAYHNSAQRLVPAPVFNALTPFETEDSML